MTQSGSDHILVAVAWPYVNGPQHIGHIAGAYLPPDIFARYQRMQGRKVLMVSGSDTHGTPVTVRAEEEGVEPVQLATKFHEMFIESYQQMGLTFDWFTSTHTQTHQEVVQETFTKLLDQGYIYKDSSQQMFDKQAQRFLPDRYIEGTCPKCGFEEARGDQCDNCGKTYDAIELKNPVSKVTGSKDLEVRETEHFYFDLGKLNQPLSEWLASTDRSHWRRHVYNFTKGELDKQELRGRAITRDMEWGIEIPLEGYDSKRIYVWFEAVQGYLSAPIEWAKEGAKDPEAWRQWWDKDVNPDARSYYFIGKDNITFHTIMWPAELIARGGLNTPYDVPANEYLNSYGRKFSKSRGTSIGVLDVLERYEPDAWRYALTALAPESTDVDFTWDDFLEKVNNELIANWGNLANRMLGFAYKRYDGQVPAPNEMQPEDTALLDEVRGGFGRVGQLYEQVKLKSALEEVRRLSQRVNQYLNDTAPWTTIKSDAERAATCVYVSLQCIAWLRLMWAPILPFGSQKIHEALGFDGELFGRQYTVTVEDQFGSHKVLRYDHSSAVGEWRAEELKPGQAMNKPQAPFQKLDPAIVEQETQA